VRAKRSWFTPPSCSQNIVRAIRFFASCGSAAHAFCAKTHAAMANAPRLRNHCIKRKKRRTLCCLEVITGRFMGRRICENGTIAFALCDQDLPALGLFVRSALHSFVEAARQAGNAHCNPAATRRAPKQPRAASGMRANCYLTEP